jgi:3',5'-cyclic AMP phosphodiesterase CpdA
MHVSLISDLHLDFSDLTLPGGDVLIISGDLCEAKRIRRDLYQPEGYVMLPHERSDRRPDRFYRFLQEECSAKYRHTIYVAGNHEFYGNFWHRTHDQIRANLPDRVTFLENETLDIDGVVFVGATLWTDMNKSHPLTMMQCRDAMNDYRSIKRKMPGTDQVTKLRPENTVYAHESSVKFITETVEADPARTYVMVTHHAPSLLSIHPDYAANTTNGAYASDLSELFLNHPQIRVATHGHTHDRFKYQVGDAWVLCNPRGYVGYEAIAMDFRPRSFNIDVTGVVTFDEDNWE